MAIQVALVRGNGMNSWEGRMWNNFDTKFDITGFCSRKNLFPVNDLLFPIIRLKTTSDSSVYNKISWLTSGTFQKMHGLESELKKFSIAHTVELYNYYTYQAVEAKKKNKNLKVVTTVWDNSFGRFEYEYAFSMHPPTFWREKIKKIIANNIEGVDRFVAVSEYSRRLLEDYGVPEEKIRIIKPALALTTKQEALLIEKYNLANTPFFLMVNRLKKEKGVYDVLYAWKMYLKNTNQKNPLLVIVGNGPERENILRLIREWGIEKQVLYIQNLPNQALHELYQHARALILASIPTPLWQEQFGYVLAEALSCGCPVVATASGSIPEVVGDAGILCPPGNPIALMEGLRTFESESHYAEYRDRALKSKERFAQKRFQKEMSELYSELV